MSALLALTVGCHFYLELFSEPS